MNFGILDVRKMVALLMLALLVGCATFQKPETIEDRIGYATATLTASYKTITALHQRGRITREEGQRLLSDADGVDAALKAASSAFNQGAFTDAEAALNVGLSALLTLERTLQEKQK